MTENAEFPGEIEGQSEDDMLLIDETGVYVERGSPEGLIVRLLEAVTEQYDEIQRCAYPLHIEPSTETSQLVAECIVYLGTYGVDEAPIEVREMVAEAIAAMEGKGEE